MKRIFGLGALVCLILMNAGVVRGEDQMVADGKTVTINYTLTVDGEVVDTSVGQKPLEYVQGEKMIIPGLESQVAGMKPGDKKTVVVAPEDAYGLKDDRAIIEVPKSNFSSDQEPQVGMQIQLANEAGQPVIGVIKEVKEDTLVLDFNHPLAGKELTFDVEVVDVK